MEHLGTSTKPPSIRRYNAKYGKYKFLRYEFEDQVLFKDYCTYLRQNPDWKELPTLCVAKILKNLPMEDRFSAAMCCRNWLPALLDPEVWRFCKLSLQREPAKISMLAQKVGPFVRSLELRVTESGFTTEQSHRQSRLAAHNMAALRHFGTVRLKSLRIKGAERFAAWLDGRATKRFVVALVRFVNGQTCLETLDLRNSFLKPFDVMRLCRAAGYRSGSTLKNLHLSWALGAVLDLTNMEVIPFTLPQNALEFLRVLTTLSMSVIALTDDVLLNLPTSLKTLVLLVRRDDPPDDLESSTESGWKRAIVRCPKLAVHVVIGSIWSLGTVGPSLPAIVPVRSIFMRTTNVEKRYLGHLFQAPEILPALATLLERFAATIVSLEIRLGFGTKQDMETILAVAAQCPHLQIFRFNELTCCSTAPLPKRWENEGDSSLYPQTTSDHFS